MYKIDMTKLHYLSGLLIAAFVGVHIVNHINILWGKEFYMATMDLFRIIYRNSAIETLLLLAVVVQIITGIKLYIRNRKQASTFFEKLHIRTGLYLAFFFVIHITAVMVGRAILHQDTNFYYGAAGLNQFPFNLYFIPYYLLAIISFFGHLTAVHHVKMKESILGITPVVQSIIILIVGCALAMIVVWGMTNGFRGFAIPTEYQYRF